MRLPEVSHMEVSRFISPDDGEKLGRVVEVAVLQHAPLPGHASQSASQHEIGSTQFQA